MFSSITKKGVTESANNPRVVLVIHNNIYLIKLMSIQDKYFMMFNDLHGMDYKCGPLKIIRTRISKSSRLYIFI